MDEHKLFADHWENVGRFRNSWITDEELVEVERPLLPRWDSPNRIGPKKSDVNPYCSEHADKYGKVTNNAFREGNVEYTQEAKLPYNHEFAPIQNALGHEKGTE